MTINQNQPRAVDVVIIGMGPVGALSGLLLARSGHSVLVVERKEKAYPLPRAVAHDAEIARILQYAGMAPDTMPDAVEPYDDMYVWVNGEDVPIHKVDWTGVGPSGWNNTYFYNQPALEAKLSAHLGELPNVEIHRGVAAILQDQDEDNITVTLTDLGTQETSQIRAKYVLGADGANSETRAALDIPWNDLGYFFDWLVVDVIPGADLHIDGLAKQVCDPARPTTVVPGGPGRRRWEFMLLNGEAPEAMARPERIWELLEPFGVTPGNAELERGVVYTFSSGWAHEWQHGRAFLLGDAAHKMPPFAGQGLAAGFRDCMNLCWKLDLALRGVGDTHILDTYTQERSAHVADFIEFSMSLGRIICITDRDEAADRDRQMLAAMAAQDSPPPPPQPLLGPGIHTGPQGGSLSWQGFITTNSHPDPQRFDDAFGGGALILADPSMADGLSPEELDLLGKTGIAITTFGVSRQRTSASIATFIDTNGTYTEWFREIGATAVLIRPDFYTYGSASDAHGVQELVTSFLTHFASEPQEFKKAAQNAAM